MCKFDLKYKIFNNNFHRPDDYFAEMAKTDEHMQKVRKHLLAKQEGQAKSERMKQLREQRKLGKQLQVSFQKFIIIDFF